MAITPRRAIFKRGQLAMQRSTSQDEDCPQSEQAVRIRHASSA